ncbi:hypothetical protein FK220_009490 [Flavobacteriaceae bacterium TP-CH-4]|uniref:Uncharacterized protein n=1 Tax=Pelagihabitans pacificus TaxID=2696054 RepID=A0A967ATD4_9FLAO|nr:hypothetical protein [Pelagihabitans pacificus]NHF59572.1 hypothetical protein [Pelagihabitans pacificus]
MRGLKKSKWRFIWILPIALLGMTAMAELLYLDLIDKEMETQGKKHLIVPLGKVKLLCVTAFLIPKTRRIGFLRCAAYIGGIIAVDWIMKEPPLPGILLQTFLWVGMYFEVPQFFYLERTKSRKHE